MKADTDHLVEFINVQKTYDGEELVVKNLNLKIKSGEFLTMLGPSGSVKTTCLMCIAGFPTPRHAMGMLGNVYLIIDHLTREALVWFFKITHCFPT